MHISMQDVINIIGAKEHNLKNLTLKIPKKTLTVITGLSGSGKSSLAFDTIYAEGQRRYVESLSAYARQFLNLSQKPDVEHIDGLSPAIAIEQKTTSKNPRSTVGTVTEIYDYLRLLFAQAGTPHCPEHNVPIEGMEISQMIDALQEWPEGVRLHVLAPVVRGRKGEYKAAFKEWQKAGFTRVRVNGELYDVENAPELEKHKKHTIDVIVDRLAWRLENRTRLADSIQTALKLSDGLVSIEPVMREDEAPLEAKVFSAQNACPVCSHVVPKLEPRLFSFNSPFGACPTCDGLGQVLYFDENLIVPDPALSLADGAVAIWQKRHMTARYYMDALSKHYGFSLNTPWQELPEDIQHIILHGSGKESIAFTYSGGRSRYRTNKPFEGVMGILQRRFDEADNPEYRDELNNLRSGKPCPDCCGARLNKDALAVRVLQHNMPAITECSVKDAIVLFEDMKQKLQGNKAIIAAPILKEITARLGFLQHVGLEYLSLSRTAGTLSGGESQRIRLASQIGSGLTGVLYVLDEPSIGLHQRDNRRLLEMLLRLRDLDNTVLVVEHDEDAILAADHLIDMGPGAGEYGGHVVAEGAVDVVKQSPHSITGQYLRGERKVDVPKKRRKCGKPIIIKGASANNLQQVDVEFPTGVMTCVTGVSGSGKSTLVMETLYKAVARKLNGARENPGEHTALTGTSLIDKIVHIDQSPIGRTPRSNPATYTGIMDPIRKWMANLQEAKARGYGPGRFSFNVKGGRCEACSGDGMIKVEMHFLADVYVPCEVCDGKRYNRETLEIDYKGKNIADILHMPVAEALSFFSAVPMIKNKLQTLQDVGLGYIRLGQSALTLSGGEAQRIKLSKELSKRSTGKTLYILDEPTTGLHFEDINQLLKVLHRLVDEGNTMVIIEHNLDVIKTADWVIDIGPEGGDGGGRVVATGTPEQVAKVKNSHTGHYLAPLLQP